MNVTQEVVQAEASYRLERAHNAALVQEARKARRNRPSRLRRWLTGTDRPAVRRATPALP